MGRQVLREEPKKLYSFSLTPYARELLWEIVLKEKISASEWVERQIRKEANG